MIIFYLLVSVMPMIRHPLWSDVVGDLTVIKYLGLACAAYAVIYLPNRDGAPNFFGTAQARWFMVWAFIAGSSFLAFGLPRPYELSPFMSCLSFLLFYVVTMIVVDSLDRFRWSILVAVGSVAYASLHVIREWQKYGNMSFGYRPGWVTGDPNYFSVSALLCLPLAFYLLRTKQVWWERAFCIGSICLTLPALTLAGSRGAFLGLSTVLGFVVWRSENRRRTMAIAAAILLPVMVLTPASPLDRLLNPSRSDVRSTDLRQALWASGINMVKAYPLTGVGAGNFKPFAKIFADPSGPQRLNLIAHNSYVSVVAETGLPGFLAFMAVFVCTFISLERVRKAHAGDKTSVPYQAAQGMQTGLLGFLVSAFFVTAEYQKLYWLLIFLSAALATLAPARAAEPAGPAPTTAVRAARRRPVGPRVRTAVVAAIIGAGAVAAVGATAFASGVR